LHNITLWAPPASVFVLTSYVSVIADLHSCPTRRSSDLGMATTARRQILCYPQPVIHYRAAPWPSRTGRKRPAHAWRAHRQPMPADRQSTRLNSSHVKIPYAVFCSYQTTKTSESPNPRDY